MFFFSSYFYIITVALQVICILHCMRRGTQQKWIWILIFLPLVGCIIYIFTEIFSRRDFQQIQSGMSSVFNPSGQIRKLEENLRFSDTFNNRVALADEYLLSGQTDRAIDLYESSLTGNFIENEHVQSQLLQAYFQKKKFSEVIQIGQKLYGRPQFIGSRSRILFAMALDQNGEPEKAEDEFKAMKARYANFEARYQYALFLRRYGHEGEALELLKEITSEAGHLGAVERKANRQWLELSKAALKKK